MLTPEQQEALRLADLALMSPLRRRLVLWREEVVRGAAELPAGTRDRLLLEALAQRLDTLLRERG